MNMTCRVAASIALLASISPAWGMPFSIDDPVYGVGSITRDPATGLEWLDLTLTTNRTYLEVQGQFGSVGAFAGFQHASIDEIDELWINAGIPTIVPAYVAPGGFIPENAQPVFDLLGLIGATEPFPGQPIRYTRGVTGLSLTTTPNFQYVATLRWNTVGGRASLTEGVIENIRRDDAVGHWLVRQSSVVSVPEPGTLALLGLGLAGLGLARRKRVA